MMFAHLDDPVPFVPDETLRAGVHRAGTRRRRRRRLLGTAAGSALSLALVVGAVAAFARNQADDIGRVDIGAAPVGPSGILERPFTMLVVGVDGGRRTDTIMLVRIDPAARAVRGVTIPRDLQVAIPGHGEDRINTALGYGRDVLVETVRQSLGVPVDHYAEVGFDALAHLVDGAGGVPLYFLLPVRDEASGLYVDGAGCRTLSGTDALALARARHLEVRQPDGRWVTDPRSDFSRMGNAPVVLRALVRRAGERAGGLGGFAALATLATDEIVVDDRLGAGDLVALGDWSRTVPESATYWYFPGLRDVQRPDRAQVLVFDPAEPRLRENLEGPPRPAGPGAGTMAVPLGPDLAVRPCP